MTYAPLSVRYGSELVQQMWSRGIDYQSVDTLRRLEALGRVRKVPIGWWLADAGWCPTIAVLQHALIKRGLIRMHTTAPEAAP